MSDVATLYFSWQQVGPLHSGYGYTLAQAVGKIQLGARRSAQLETHPDAGAPLTPAFLASSVKGVFRAASAWLVERTARQLGATTYATCDYQGAVPKRWRKRFDVPKTKEFCPVCRVYGGAGCLSAVRPGKDETLRRQVSRVRFTFRDADDALHGSAAWGRKQTFAWEKASGKTGQLKIENFEPPAQPSPRLEVRVDRADDFALALVTLSADLIGSGLFRFGRFVSRGYGSVQLSLTRGEYTGLDVLLREGKTKTWKVPDLEEMRTNVRTLTEDWLNSWA